MFHESDLQDKLMEEIRTILSKVYTFLPEVEHRTRDSQQYMIWFGQRVGPEILTFLHHGDSNEWERRVKAMVTLIERKPDG